MSITISIPRERKPGETRVAATPSLVSKLVKAGAKIGIETAAGSKSSFSDEDYISAGASIHQSLEETWNNAELLLKVKEPAPEELDLMRPGLSVFSFLHPAAAIPMTAALLKHKVLGLDFDLVREADGSLPILAPMSEIAGRLAVYAAAEHLMSSHKGLGLLLSGTSTSQSARVCVIGAGVSGAAAAALAAANGADVSLLDINEKRLEQLANQKAFENVKLLPSTTDSILECCTRSEVVIGAVLIPGEKAPKLLKTSMLPKMQKGSILIDICIDQGGFAESSKTTSIEKPTYIEAGVSHYCVPNMPGLVPLTATTSLSNALEPYLLKIAKHGIEGALVESKALAESLITRNGKLTHPAVKNSIGSEFDQ
ncbi:UNVERIFIED_CONTAM: hypothetical protein GTU68_020962 [Idotea baltica]|nr:hypothetical protein [Idotea baltica]